MQQAYAPSAPVPGMASSGQPKHFVEPLPYMFPSRICIIVFSVLTMGMGAGAVGYYGGYYFTGWVFAICCAIFTWIGTGYVLFAERNNRGIYNIWAVLAVDFVLTVFWLSCMAVNASILSVYLYVETVTGGLTLGILLASLVVLGLYTSIFIGMMVHASRAGVFGGMSSGGAMMPAQQQMPVQQQMPGQMVMQPQPQQQQAMYQQQQTMPMQQNPVIPTYTNSAMPVVGQQPGMYSPVTSPIPQQQAMYASPQQ